MLRLVVRTPGITLVIDHILPLVSENACIPRTLFIYSRCAFLYSTRALNYNILAPCGMLVGPDPVLLTWMSTDNPHFDSCDFVRLTVPQLKKLCKNRVTGYSKLAKSALVQKLEEYRRGQRSTAQPLCTSSISIIPSVVPEDASTRIDISNNMPVKLSTNLPAFPLESALHQRTTSRTSEADTIRQPEARPTTLNALPLCTSILLHEGHQSSISTSSSLNPALLSAPIRKRSSQPILDSGHSFRSPKRPKLLDTSNLSKPTPLNAVLKVPALPQRLQVLTPAAASLQSTGETRRSDHVYPTPTLGSIAAPLSASLDSSKSAPKRFVPLIQKDLVAKPVGPKDNTKDNSHTKAPFYVVEPIPPMTSISIPPKLAQRKLVKSYAVILQGLSNAERRACAGSNRLIRYAGQYSHITSNQVDQDS